MVMDPTNSGFGPRLARLLKHGWTDVADARRALGPGALDRLQQAVQASEAHHSGEIRLCIEASLSPIACWHGATARERAVAVFGELGVWDTEHNNGVLIYLLVADRAIEIVADRGLSRWVDGAQWQAIVERMREAFAAGHFEAGLQAAIAAVDTLLRSHFPRQAGVADRNELPDLPVLR
jgi:uncharacterized membrane protein